MYTQICKDLGIEVPIFAFSHCRDVVVEVSKAGGLGVLGAGKGEDDLTEEELEKKLWAMVPQGHLEFADKLLDDNGVPHWPEEGRPKILGWTLQTVMPCIEEALTRPGHRRCHASYRDLCRRRRYPGGSNEYLWTGDRPDQRG